jgi:hypothetical protein
VKEEIECERGEYELRNMTAARREDKLEECGRS